MLKIAIFEILHYTKLISHKVKASKMLKTAIFAILHFPKLISRKISESGQLGRSTSRAHAVAAAAIAAGSGNGGSEAVTMYTTASALARAFSIVVRTISDLLSLLQDYGPLTPPLNRMLDISQSEAVSLQLMIEATLKLNWDWLMTVMDSTEAQLRFGSALTNSTDPNQPGHPLSRTSTGSRMTSSSAEASTSTRSLTSSRYGATLASFSASTGSGTATVQGMKKYDPFFTKITFLIFDLFFQPLEVILEKDAKKRKGKYVKTFCHMLYP